MAENKGKRTLSYEKQTLVEVNGAKLSRTLSTPSSWSAGRIPKKKQEKRKRGGKENTIKIILCGGENQASLKRDGTVVPLGGGSPTKVIRTFKCQSNFQDQLYGKNMRIANAAEGKGAQKDRYRCSTCLRETVVRS